jgi:hypothetical protein
MRIRPLIFLVLLPIFAGAQITIASADLPSAGNSFLLSTADTLLALDPEPTGENYTWDFSFLEPVAQSTENWVSPLETDILYFFLFGSSNVAQSVFLPEIPGLELTDAYNFYQKNSSKFAQSGLAGKFTGLPIVIPFENEDRIFSLPLNYGDSETDESAFEFEVPTVANLREERSRSNTVDGWGTLITPFGSFDVLRHKSVVDIRDTISGSLGNFSVERRTIEYRWLGNGTGLPLLQIDAQEITGMSFVSRIAYQDSLRVEPLGINATLFQQSDLFPNPAQTAVTLRGQLTRSSSLQTDLLNTSGQVLRSWPAEPAPAGALLRTYGLTGIAPGSYWLRVHTPLEELTLPLQIQ